MKRLNENVTNDRQTIHQLTAVMIQYNNVSLFWNESDTYNYALLLFWGVLVDVHQYVYATYVTFFVFFLQILENKKRRKCRKRDKNINVNFFSYLYAVGCMMIHRSAYSSLKFSHGDTWPSPPVKFWGISDPKPNIGTMSVVAPATPNTHYSMIYLKTNVELCACCVGLTLQRLHKILYITFQEMFAKLFQLHKPTNLLRIKL